MLKIFYLIASFSFINLWAVSGASNGGNVYINTETGKISFLDLIKLPSSEFLEINNIDIEFLNTHKNRDAADDTYYFPNYGNQSQSFLILLLKSDLEFYLVNENLKNTNDEGLVYSTQEFNGVIKTVGVQSRELGTVAVNRRLYQKMSLLDKVAFIIHEKLIRAWYNDNPKKELVDTAQIASIVNVLFNSPDLTGLKLSKQLCIAGLFASPYLGSEDSHLSFYDRQSFRFFDHPSAVKWRKYVNNPIIIAHRYNNRCYIRELRYNNMLVKNFSYKTHLEFWFDETLNLPNYSVVKQRTHLTYLRDYTINEPLTQIDGVNGSVKIPAASLSPNISEFINDSLDIDNSFTIWTRGFYAL